ncbi:MAG TPA: hypothetical protein VNA20_02005 [Frankiaceae bacterium]|nr:hypothetical protein [Frankiaceae bacterium]
MRLQLATALLVAATASPAAAHEVNVNSRSSHSIADDASVCFEIEMAGPITAAASSAGAVRTERSDPTLQVVQRGTMGPPTNYYAEHGEYVTVHDFISACLPGMGSRVVGGFVVLTLVANGRTAAVVIVVHCTFSPRGPNCS